MVRYCVVLVSLRSVWILLLVAYNPTSMGCINVKTMLHVLNLIII